MPARSGPEHHNSGPHLRPTGRTRAETEDLRDPALGEKVPRCLTCGSPAEPITGTFIPDRSQKYAGRPFRYRLCVHCLAHANGPQAPDPLHVEAA